MNYEPSENFWKSLYTRKEMMRKIVWNVESEEYFYTSAIKDGERVINALSLRDAKKTSIVLDFGCGIGRLLKYIQENTGLVMIGVDISHPMIEMAKKECEGLNDVHLSVMLNSVIVPVESGLVDFVYSHIVLQHINKYKVFFILKEFSRVLKADGEGFIQLPNLIKCMNGYEKYAYDFVQFNDVQISAMNFWTKEEAELILDQAGLEVTSITEEDTDLFIKFKKKELIK